jgi:nicotinamidase-related amidase
MEKILTVKAEPYDFEFEPDATVLMVIDVQNDFVNPGGFGEFLGNDVSLLRAVINPIKNVLEVVRGTEIRVIHTREGHRPDLSDCPQSKLHRGNLKISIGDEGPMGRVLIRGQKGHDIIDELKPLEGEPIIDKPGKGSFYATDLHLMLQNWGIKYLVITGVTTEVCVHTTVREANDRGYECLVLDDCVASYFPEFQDTGLKMIKAQGGIFGWVASSRNFIDVIKTLK